MIGGSARRLRLQRVAIAATISFCALFALAEEPLSYRRVLVPADDLAGQIRGLLPLKREDFDRRVAIAGRASEPISESVVRLQQASFQARLDGTQLTGSATLPVTLTENQSAMLPIVPCSFAIESMVWSQNEPRSAVFGAAEDGRLLCLVDESGELLMKWHQAASKITAEHLVFDLKFPAAPRRDLVLNVPAEYELRVDSGLIVANEPSQDETNRRNWIIQLTGRPALRLEAVPRTERSRGLAASVVRDSVTYQVLPTTIDFETTLNLDVLQGSIDDITLGSQQPAQLLTVQVDGQPARFFPASDDNEANKRYAIHLPTPISGVNHSITATGTATRTEADSWRLPRFLPISLSVEQGIAEVNAPSWLQLHPKSSTDCVQATASSAFSNRNIDRFGFLLLSPSAEVEMTTNRSLQPLTENSGTQLHFETNQVTGVFTAEIASRAPNLFALDAQISQQWIIDAVETQPPDALADRATTSGPNGVQRLRLHLARPVSIARPVRVVIRAHARRPAINELLDEHYFRFARFPDARGGRQWLSVNVWDPHLRFEQRGKSPYSLLNAEELTAQDRSLFEEPASQIYRLESELKGTLAPAKAQYHADLSIRAEAVQHGLTQKVSIHCLPETSPVPSILIRLSPPPAGDATWRLAGEKLVELPATLETPPDAGSEGAYFRISLPKAQSTAFEVVGEWTAPLAANFPVTLITLPEAAHQQGLLELYAPANRFQVATTNLKPLPIIAGKSHAQANLRGRFQYDSGRSAKATLQAIPSVEKYPHAWIEAIKLVSQFSTDGRGEHEMELIVHPAGDEVLHLTSPANARHCRQVDESGDEQLLQATGGGFRFSVPLQSESPQMTLRIRYLSETNASGIWPIVALQAPLLKPDAIVLERCWHTLIPPPYAPLVANVQKPSGNVANSGLGPQEKRGSPPFSWTNILAGPALVDRFFDHPDEVKSDKPGYQGWFAVESQLAPGAAAELWVYRSNLISAWFWCLALAGAALACLAGQAWKCLLATVAVLSVIAATFTQPWSSLAEGMAIGLVIGGVQSLLARWQSNGFIRPRAESRPPRLGNAIGNPIAFIALLSVASIFNPRVAAQQSEDARPRAVIPVDSAQQPAGDYVYVNEALYDALYGNVDASSDRATQWLLENAHYEVPGAPQIRGEKPSVDEIRCSFDFYTFHDSTLIKLPMRREQAFLLEGRARLDGQPAKLTWRPDGEELSLLTADSGKHRLELALGATAARTDDGLLLDLKVPPAGRATVRLPNGGKLLTASGSIPFAGHDGTFCLPDHQALKIIWPATNFESSTAAQLEADQLSLWRIRSGAVVLESLIRVKPNGRPVRELLLECDPRLRVLPPSGTTAINRLSSQEGAPNLVKVEFAEPIESTVSLRLTWLWPDATGLGQWTLPQVRVRADRIVREWTAVWHEPGLSVQCSAPAGGPKAADFGAAFGENDIQHIAGVWDVSREQAQFIECKPESTLPRAEESLELILAPTTASLRFTAELKNVPRYCFEHRVAIPDVVRLKQAAIIQHGRSVPLGWEKTAKGQVTLYLLESPEPDQTLELIGELPLQPRELFQPPQVELQNVDRSPMTLQVFRHAELQVSLQSSEGWTAMDEPLGRFESGRGRLVAALRGSSIKTRPPRFAIAPNRPHVTGQSLVRVQQEDNEWTWEADLDLHITDGFLDELVAALPRDAANNIDVFPEMAHDVETLPAQQRRVIIRPAVAATGPLQVRLRGSLIGNSEGIVAPEIVWEDLSNVRTLVLLDRGAGDNQFDWDTTALAPLDESSRQALPAHWRSHSGDWYQAPATGYHAIAHARDVVDGTYQIPLLDLRGELVGQRLKMSADVIVLPTPGSEVQFSLPTHCRLLQILVDDMTVQPVSCGLRSWKLPSISNIAPFRLSILYDTFLAHRSHRALKPVSPQFVGGHPEQTLFSISGASQPVNIDFPAVLPHGSLKDYGIAECEPGQAELIRIRALARAIDEIASSQDGTIPAAIATDTFEDFESEFSTALRMLEKEAESDGAPQSLLQQAAISLDVVRRSRLRFEHAGLSLPVVAPNDPIPAGTSSRVGQPARYLISGNLSEFSVRVSDNSGTRGAREWILTALLLAGAVGLLVIPSAWIIDHPIFGSVPLQLAVIAAMWWLLAPAGWLGLAGLAVAAIIALRSSRPATIREGGSSLLKRIADG